MKQLEKVIESKVKIRFPDCDPFNHLNNSKYIDYFLNAREDQLLSYYDFDLHKLAREQGISWVVAQNQIAYLVPASLMETVVVQTQLLSYAEKNLVVEATMWNEEKTILKALLWSKFVHFNLKTQKSEIHSAELMNLFKQIENPQKEQVSFEKRVENQKYANALKI
jgi:YbgC/YbaW family acyl-CoA thioester hydrolase